MDTQVINVDGALFEFADGWQVQSFDEWFASGSGHRNQLSGDSLIKAKNCDILALEPGNTTLWLIEVKDYDWPDLTGPAKAQELAPSFAKKVFDTLAQVFLLARFGHHPAAVFCREALQASQIKVALSVDLKSGDRLQHKKNEQYLLDLRKHINQKLKALGIDPASTILDSSLTRNPQTMDPWNRRRDPETRKRRFG